jgi:hypothetical protein
VVNTAVLYSGVQFSRFNLGPNYADGSYLPQRVTEVSTFMLLKLTVTQLVKDVCAFYGSWSIVAYSEPIEFDPRGHVLLPCQQP